MPVTPSRDRRRSSRGQSLVELALIAPVFLILLLTAIDLGKGQITGISYNSVAPLEQRLDLPFGETRLGQHLA